jgi:UPF0042 nucleotide-binding protein
MVVSITSFGYLHGDAPAAEVVIDLRHHFRDPHVNPELRYLTAEDQAVRDAVWNTPGIQETVAAAAVMVRGFMSGPSAEGKELRIATGCAGGRHRAASVALELQHALDLIGIESEVTHRDLDKDVVERVVTS